MLSVCLTCLGERKGWSKLDLGATIRARKEVCDTRRENKIICFNF